MRNILSIIIICSMATMSAFAQMNQGNKAFGQTDYDEMTSNRAIMNSPRYSSPIYEPFSNTTPSEQTEIGSEQTSHKGHIRRGFEGNTDPGITDDESSPIGDAVVPLIMALAVYCAVRVYRRKRRV